MAVLFLTVTSLIMIIVLIVRSCKRQIQVRIYIYIYNYIDQKMCTLYPYTYTEIYIGTFAGQSAFRIMFNLIQFYESELRSRLKSIKSLLFFKEKRSTPRACYGGARFHFTEVDCWSIPSHRRDAHLRFSRIGMSSEKFNHQKPRFNDKRFRL